MAPRPISSLLSAISFAITLHTGAQGFAQAPETGLNIASPREVVEILSPHTKTLVLGREGNAMLVVTPELGGMVVAAALRGLDAENLLWTWPGSADPAAWQRGIGWLLGGNRTALAPQFGLVSDTAGQRSDPPAPMQPEGWSQGHADAQTCEAEYRTQFKSILGGQYALRYHRRVELHGSGAAAVNVTLPPGVEAMAFTIRHAYTNEGTRTIGTDLAPVGLWDILMVPVSGTAILPLGDPPPGTPIWRDYSHTLGPEYLRVTERAVLMRVDGLHRAKLGIRPAAATRFVAYLRHAGPGAGQLYIQEFDIDPTGTYVDHPRDDRAGNGDVAQVYISDTTPGRYAELESHGAFTPVPPGGELTHTVRVSIFSGPLPALLELGAEVTGLQMNDLPLF